MTKYVSEQIAASSESGFSSTAAEQGIIAQMLSNRDIARRHSGALSASDFYDPERGKLFAAIQATVAKNMNVDIVTVDTTIGEMFPAEHMTLTNAMMGCVNAMALEFRSVEDYITIVRSLSQRRRVIGLMEGFAKSLRDPSQDIAGVIDQIRLQTSAVIEGRHAWVSMQDMLLHTYDYLEKMQRGDIHGITTGIENIDKLIGGFFAGELTIIGARPSVGKSAFGVNVAIAAAKTGCHVGVVSREMSDIQYGQRMISRASNVDGMKLRKASLDDNDWIMITESLPDLNRLPISFMFNISTVEDLRLEVQNRVERGELELLIVDYLGLMQTRKPFREEHLRIGYICKALKAIAVDFNIPVVCLAQVNRDSDCQMPTLRNLKASGDIEQDADGVIFLHLPLTANDEYVNPKDKESFEAYKNVGYKYLCLSVAKQRQGATGRTNVLFDAAHMKYIEIDRTERGEQDGHK